MTRGNPTYADLERRGNKKHWKSVFYKETELLKAIIDIHLAGKDIECDPMYFKGNFYKDGVNRPKIIMDLNPKVDYCPQGDARNTKIPYRTLNSIILDPPFMFGVHGKTEQYYSSRTHTIFNNFNELKDCYLSILLEAKSLLKDKGILIFKCQDYTDNKTTMTHAIVWDWATQLGFYEKDLAILVKPNKIYNPNLVQRHFRKIHTYFWIFQI